MIRHEGWVRDLNPTYGSLFSPDRNRQYGVLRCRRSSIVDRVPQAIAPPTGDRLKYFAKSKVVP
ncbi:MAG: hypothetical protein EBE86_021610 [Hormoscilla sp. GUM202]|nr:hypothetical protein [Hormoscilla sp. GM7CHS1pb]MBO1349808.1 hypothetical protein [Hormoscilla sp. GUM202]